MVKTTKRTARSTKSSRTGTKAARGARTSQAKRPASRTARAAKPSTRAKGFVKRAVPKKATPKRAAPKRLITAVKVVKPMNPAMRGVTAKAIQAVPTAEPKGRKSVPASSASGPTGMPREGELAPDFVLPDHDGHSFQLSKLRGSPVVLYFYPKDDTPGCTIEAREFSRDIELFRKKGIIVLGVSKDTPESHWDFIEKYDLLIPLLSDVDAKVIRQYGCWKEKNMYGKKVWGTQRATFVIAADGHIMKVFPNVTPEGHTKEILKIFK